MRIRSLLVVAIMGACVSNPDPRKPSLEKMQQGGWGGWIVATMRDDSVVQGELISVEPGELRVLDLGTGMQLFHVPLAVIDHADLYAYEPQGGLIPWGLVGAASTLSHGVWLIFSGPVWLATTAAVAALESRHVIHRYPDDPWPTFAQWARFPQGMPPRLLDQELFQQVRMPAVAAPPPPAPAPVPEPAPSPTPILHGPTP